MNTVQRQTDIFNAATKEGSDSLSETEFKAMVIGKGYTKKFADEMLKQTGGPPVVLGKFLDAMAKVEDKIHGDANVRAIFRKFDPDKNGMITPEELAAGMAELGCPMTVDEAREEISAVDKDKDGKMNLEEYMSS